MTQKRRLAWALALLFVVNIAVISLAQQAEAATYRQGSSGEQVRIIQTKLKNWGYYDGAVDGIYGSQTAQAVKYFQRKNGLTADGIAGPATLKALGMSSGGGGSSSQQNSAALLARVISAEARGEPYSGQVAVGAVILNRVEHPSFPNTIAGVVYQPGAFTCMVDGLKFDFPAGGYAPVVGVLLFDHVGDVVCPALQRLRQAVAGEHHLQARGPLVQKGAELLLGQEAPEGVDHFVQHQQAGILRPGQLRRLPEERPAVLRHHGLLLVVHLEGELVDALAAQDGEGGKPLRRSQLPAGAAFEELGDHHPPPPARTPEGQPEGRCGLTLAVSIIDLHQAIFFRHAATSFRSDKISIAEWGMGRNEKSCPRGCGDSFFGRGSEAVQLTSCGPPSSRGCTCAR